MHWYDKEDFDMHDSYLDTFNNLFFNVDDNSQVKNTLQQVSAVLSSIITRFGEIENEICYGISKQDDFVDIVLCLFIRKIIEQIDAINVLFSVGSFAQAQIILRSLVENIVSLQFILKEDTKKRAAAYWLEHHYQEIEMGDEIFNTESDLKRKIIVNKGQEAFDADMNKFQKKKEAFERIVKSEPVFQEIDRDRKEKKGKRKHIKWYEVCSNVKTIKGLIIETGYEQYYDSIYGGLSYEVHAYNSTMDISFNENKMCLKPIRNPVNGSSTFSLTCTFSMGLLVKIYEYLNDGEMEKKELKKFFIEFQKKRNIACHNLDLIV